MDTSKLKNGEIIEEIKGFVGLIGQPYNFGKFNVNAQEFELILDSAETITIQFRNRDKNEVKNMDNLLIKNNPKIQGGTVKASVFEDKGEKRVKIIVTKTAIVEKLDKNGNVIRQGKTYQNFRKNIVTNDNREDKIKIEKLQSIIEQMELRLKKVEDAIKSIL